MMQNRVTENAGWAVALGGLVVGKMPSMSDLLVLFSLIVAVLQTILLVRKLFFNKKVVMTTAAEQLVWVEAAIQDILKNGQHVSASGRTYTKADLSTLEEMESKYRRLSSGSFFGRTKTIIPRR